jgi:NADH-quinone oxidoreductase subunit C
MSLTSAALTEALSRDLPDALQPAAVLRPTAAPAHGPAPAALETADPLIAPAHIAAAACYLRDQHGYSYLSDIAVVDYLRDELLELVYRFYHPQGGPSVCLRVRVGRDEPQLPSLTPHWPGADFHEREAYDLFGVTFVGHPYLRRIYMWDEFVGYPMRKDFPRQGDKYLGGDE